MRDFEKIIIKNAKYILFKMVFKIIEFLQKSQKLAIY